ncbi:MAG: protein kinase domain-containing protein [Pseudonocardiales bacterium]
MVIDAGQQPEPTRFDFHRIVGRSAASVVWEATQISTGRLVALKVLDVDLTDEESLRRFDRERHVMGMLSGHPHIVTIYDAGIYDQRPWLAMQFCSQGSLAGKIKNNGPFPVAEAVDVLVKIGGALTLAHQRGVLHCDIKPANIMVNDFSEPALGDFGISRLTVGSATRTVSTGYSVDHAPPEVLNDERPTVAADVYSLGTTIWELVSGRPPFRQSPDTPYASAIRRILLEPLPEPTAPDVPTELASLLTRMAAKDPNDRPANMDEVVEAAREIQTRLAAQAESAPAPAPLTDSKPAGSTPFPAVADESAHTQIRRSGKAPQARPFAASAIVHPPPAHTDADEDRPHIPAFEEDASPTRIRLDPRRARAGSSGFGDAIGRFVRGHRRGVLIGASAGLVVILAGVAAILFTGGSSGIAGTYQISATEPECETNLSRACEVQQEQGQSTFTDSWQITDCEENRCSIFSPGGTWDGALDLVRRDSAWNASGPLSEEFFLSCPLNPEMKVTTDAQISFTVTDDRLDGTYKQDPSGGECLVRNSYTFKISGQPTGSTG